MKTNQSLNTNTVNSAPQSQDHMEHYLQIIRQRAVFKNPKEEKEWSAYKRLIDQIIFSKK